MNEKIKELAAQAGCDWWEGRAMRDMTRCQSELEKFAELIVLECIALAQSHPSQNEDYADGIDSVRESIEKHFGVEE